LLENLEIPVKRLITLGFPLYSLAVAGLEEFDVLVVNGLEFLAI
jgi:hypothetical protein